MHLADLETGKIAILGAGREGQSAYNWLRGRLPQQALTLIAESPADPVFAKTLRPADRLLVEPLTAARLRSFDVLIRSPGISIYREALREAADAGVRITTPSNLWFASHPAAQTICITGTKGKSTTSALLAHLLQSCGRQVRLAGNIGLPLLSCDDQGVDWWVIEMSSYQIADLEAAPTIAVFLNFSPEHLDWHGGERAYWRDKLRLAELTGQGKVIVNASDLELAGHFAAAANVIWFNTFAGVHVEGKRLFDRNILLPASLPEGLIGHHNLLNTAAALTAAGAAGLDLQQAARAVASFKCLPHRLQVLGLRKGVTYIDDSIASTPVATVAALEALQDSPIVLILGGFDRGIDWSRYASAFRAASIKLVIGLPDSGPRIIGILREAGVSPAHGFHPAPDLPTAMAWAEEHSSPGDTVLLSPGAPSFPQFSDFRDRGQTFARLSGFAEIAEGTPAAHRSEK